MQVRASVAVLVLLAGVAAGHTADPGVSVVKVTANVRGPDLYRPWAKQNAYESSGSGVVIEDKLILTNAHVVLYASEIFVQGKEAGDKVEAKVKSIDLGIDLALLTVESKDFFSMRPPIQRAKKLPQERDAVEVYGYPIGGANQSVTKGIVSRIDFVPYTGQTVGLRVQIDAALNPGNSGGPALCGNEMIGLAFSRFPVGFGANIGYIIPNEEIEAFLHNPAGKPKLTLQFQPLQNETLRKKLGLDEKTQGILINHDNGPLHKGDILTHVGPHELDNQGQVKFRDSLHLPFLYVVPQVVKHGKVPATVLRDGEELKLHIPVASPEELVLREMKGEYPSFFLYGPLVFTAATSNSAGQLARGPNFELSSPLLQRQNDKVRFHGEELVVISAPMFQHKCVRGYNDPIGRVVADVNGVKIRNLRHLVKVLRDCKDDFVTFNFVGEKAEVLVLARKDMEAVTQKVMDENSIPHRASTELAELWNHK
jgi:S1-C subfamily serine protease